MSYLYLDDLWYGFEDLSEVYFELWLSGFEAFDLKFWLIENGAGL